MQTNNEYPTKPVVIHSGLDGKKYETFVFPSNPLAFKDVEAAVVFLSCIVQEPEQYIKDCLRGN